MSTTYGEGLSERQYEWVQTVLQHESYWRTWGWSWMHKYGYIKPMPLGIIKLIETTVKETEAANMAKDPEEFRDLKIKLKVGDYEVILLGRTLTFGLRELQAWKNNTSRIGQNTSLEEATMAEFQQKLYLQLDGFTFWGTNMRHAVATDPWKGTNEITGMFNGFSTTAGGAGDDNNMFSAMDYYLTINNLIDDLVEDGFEADDYTIFSSRQTRHDADGGGTNHRNTVAGFKTELRECLAKADVARWIASPSCREYANTINRMVVVPNIENKANKVEGGEQFNRGPPFKIYQEPIRVIPLYGGGMVEGLKRKVTVYTALAWAQTNTKSIRHTGNLVFTEA